MAGSEETRRPSGLGGGVVARRCGGGGGLPQWSEPPLWSPAVGEVVVRDGAGVGGVGVELGGDWWIARGRWEEGCVFCFVLFFRVLAE